MNVRVTFRLFTELQSPAILPYHVTPMLPVVRTDSYRLGYAGRTRSGSEVRQQTTGRKHVPSRPPRPKTRHFRLLSSSYRLGRSGQLEALQLILWRLWHCCVVVAGTTILVSYHTGNEDDLTDDTTLRAYRTFNWWSVYSNSSWDIATWNDFKLGILEKRIPPTIETWGFCPFLVWNSPAA